MASFFKKLFERQAEEKYVEGNTRPLKVEEVAMLDQEAPPASHVQPAQLSAACAQSVGMQRDHNEDAIFTLTTMLAGEKNTFPFGLYIIADGMGGHSHGEVASYLAIRGMASYLIRKLYAPLFSLHTSNQEESIQEMMRRAVQEAHEAITKEAPGSGTTLTTVLILGGQMTIAHVGDSRAYAIASNGGSRALTRDHSLVKRLVELGQITTDEAAVHPQRNVLYRALGQSEPFDVDISTTPLPEDGYILICSDGLWGVVPEQELAKIVLESSGLEAACQKMVDAANEAGGPDNISVILVKIPE